MSLLRTALFGAACAAMIASSPAAAQNLIGSGWDMKEGMAYVLNPAGQMRIMPIGEHGMRMLMQHARRVPRGTVLFMHDGQLYMMQGRGVMFDRAGNWMGGGGN